MPCGWPRNVTSGPKQEHLALADRRLGHRDAAVQVVLAPRPAAAQRRRRVEPGHRLHALERRVRARAGTPGCCRRTRPPCCRRRRRAGWSGPPPPGGSSRARRTSRCPAAARCRSAGARRGGWSAAGRSGRRCDVPLPMAMIVPPSSTNFFSCGIVLSAVMLPTWFRNSSGTLAAPAPESAATAAAGVRRLRPASAGMLPFGKMMTSYLAFRSPASSAGA